MSAVDLAAAHRAIVEAILRRHLPAGSVVWVFGSRAIGRARAYSDLDLAIDAGRVLSLDEMAGLRDDFTESDLPWLVDVVDCRGVSDGFRASIAASLVKLLVIN